MKISLNLRRILITLSLLGLAALLFYPTIRAANLLSNPGFEQPYNAYDQKNFGGVTLDLEVANGWQRYFVKPGTDKDGEEFYFHSSSTVAPFIGINEKQDGADAQVWWSKRRFIGGVYQQVSGLAVDETYGFQAGILQIFGDTGSQIDGKMFRSVGIDPTGGTTPDSPSVVWSPEEGLDLGWFYPGVGVQAQSSTMTVFIRVRSIDDSPDLKENSVFADAAFLDLAPTTNLVVTIDGAAQQATASWSGSSRPDFHLFAYEAQYKKATDSTWTDLQIFNSRTAPSTATSATFAIEPGVTYQVRARTWHEQNGGREHEVPGPWAEKQIISSGEVSGKILDNREDPFSGAAVSGGTITTNSDVDGNYTLQVGTGSFSITATSSEGWNALQGVPVDLPTPQSTVPLSLTLRPPDDVIRNGDFETGPEQWQTSGITPTTIVSGRRSGAASLQLTGTVTMTQTTFISGSNRPVLSFWYRVTQGDGDDRFTAEILGGDSLTATGIFSTATVGPWQHAWLPLNLGEGYTGPVGARFSLEQITGTETIIWLDEVSLGGSRQQQQLMTSYFPLILKGQ